MFFIFAITPAVKEIDFSQSIICKSCGRCGRLNAFVRYTVLSIFFIPVFKWGKKYFVKSCCCGTLYSLDKETGRALARGEIRELSEDELHRETERGDPLCPRCGCPVSLDFEFCPRCGEKLNN